MMHGTSVRQQVASLDRLKPTSRRQRLARVVGVCLAAVGICGFLDLGGFRGFEQYFYSLRMEVYAEVKARPLESIVLVTISDKTLEVLSVRYPVPRDYHAKVIRDLTRAGAKAIAFDLLFKGPHPQEDEALADAAQKSGRVVWACKFVDDNSQGPRLDGLNDRLLQASPNFGHINIPLDPMVYRMQAVIEDNGRRVPALCLKMVMMERGWDNRAIRPVEEGWQVGDLTIPVDRDTGAFNISYARNPEEVFREVPYEKVYRGEVNGSFFRNKIVLIGDTRDTGDRHFTPDREEYIPGVQIHAHAIATLLQHRFVKEVALWINLLTLCLLAAMACLLVELWRPQWAGLAGATLLGGYLLANVCLFVERGVWLHLVAPSAGALLTAVGTLTVRALTEEREKNRARLLLGRYVSPQLASHILADPNACVLGCERVTATVLFCDIRGFTPMVTKLTAEQAVALLNEYFQAMTDVVFQHDGWVDKYVGDAIMALFGVPVPHPGHARRAVAAAIDMQNALPQLQWQLRSKGLPPIEIGIGVDTGEMVAGNIGAEQRLDFTVIGDHVNLAWRVQGLISETSHTSEMHCCILITESTYALVKEELDVRGPLDMAVRGIQEKVVVYQVLGWRAPGLALSTLNARAGRAFEARPRG